MYGFLLNVLTHGKNGKGEGGNITIRGSESSGYEGFCLLDRNAMQFVERQL
jgi:hypothetical protein